VPIIHAVTRTDTLGKAAQQFWHAGASAGGCLIKLEMAGVLTFGSGLCHRAGQVIMHGSWTFWCCAQLYFGGCLAGLRTRAGVRDTYCRVAQIACPDSFSSQSGRKWHCRLHALLAFDRVEAGAERQSTRSLGLIPSLYCI